MKDQVLSIKTKKQYWFFSLFLIAIGILSLWGSIEGGITPFAGGLIAIFLGLYFLNLANKDSKRHIETPKSLEKVSSYYVIILCILYLFGITGAIISNWPVDLMLFISIVGLGALGVGVWGTVAYIFIVLPIWWLISKLNKQKT